MAIVPKKRHHEPAIGRDDFYDRLLETIDRPDPDERVPQPPELEAMRRRIACAEVNVIIEATGRRLARAEAIAVDVAHPALKAIRWARAALDRAERESCL